MMPLDFPTSVRSQATLDFQLGGSISIASDETRQRLKIGAWPSGVTLPCRLVGRVRFDADGEMGRIAAFVNGQPVGSWRGPLTKLGKSAEAHKEFPGQLVPSLFVFRGGRTFSSWMLRVFEGEAKVLRDAGKLGVGATSSAITIEKLELTDVSGAKPLEAVHADAAPPPLPAELAALDAQFIKLQADRVTAPFEAELAKLNTSYVGGIARKITEEKTAGHLDAILALEAEQKLLTDKQPVPESDDDKTPASLKDLRKIYRDASTKLAATRAANLNDLIVPLEKRLALMETDLTKADRVADAKTVRAYREALSKGRADAPASAATGLTGTNTQGAALAGASSLPGNVSPATSLALRNGITNTLGMKLVPVPGTDVLMCIHETRYKDYAAFAAEAQGVDTKWKDQTIEGVKITDRPDDHPVTQVSLEDAQKFCAWLSKKEGKTYRLPTDKEWSIAAGIGRDEKWKKDTTPSTVSKNPDRFPWGDKWPPPKGSGNYSDMSRKAQSPAATGGFLDGYDDGFPSTAPVMSFKPNQSGLYDMGGNVWEWVAESFDNALNADRVLRGGSWLVNERGYLLSSARHHLPAGYLFGDLGFRVVIEVR